MVLSCSDFSFVLAKESVKEVILEFNFFWILPHANKKKKTIGCFYCVRFSFKDTYQVGNFVHVQSSCSAHCNSEASLVK